MFFLALDFEISFIFNAGGMQEGPTKRSYVAG